MHSEMKLNLGCGFRKAEGYVNVDLQAAAEPDLVLDLEDLPWPWPDGAIAHIRAHHVLEHLGADQFLFIGIVGEIYRTLCVGGTIEIKVPHHHCDNFWNDPTHVRPITGPMLMLFSRAACLEFKAKAWPNTPLALYHNIDLELVSTHYQLTPNWSQWLTQFTETERRRRETDHAIATYWNVVDEVTFVLRKAS